MSNAEDIDSTYDHLDEAFPTPEADKVAGPVSETPEYVTSKQLKEEADEAGKKESKGKRRRGSAPESLSSMIVFSVAVVAVVGAIIAIAKKVRET